MAIKVAEGLAKLRVKIVSRRDVRDRSNRLSKDPDLMDKVLRVLCDADYLRPETTALSKPTGRYVVNPHLRPAKASNFTPGVEPDPEPETIEEQTHDN